MKHLKVILVAALLASPLASRAADEPQKVTFEPGAWLVLGGFQNAGAFDSRELPRFVMPETVVDQKSEGWLVRQSRLRFGVNVPTDNYLAGSSVKGFFEVDFLGGTPAAGTAGVPGYTSTASAATVDPTIVRLRHAYFAANWKQMNNFTLTIGQTWGTAMQAPAAWASSLTHLAVPRFGGAGFLYRRAPQIRASADFPTGPVSLYVAGAVVSAGDLASAASGSAGNESGMPNFEGRVAAKYAASGPVKGVELGFGAHYGTERYNTGATAQKDVTANSQLWSLDGKLDLGMVTLVGGLFQGENLDVYNSVAGLAPVSSAVDVPGRLGVLLDTSDPQNPKAYEIKSQGAWAQLGVTPVKGFTIVAGLGYENPDDKTLALPGATNPGTGYILRNTQYSGGAIWNVTSKWRVSFEATRFITDYRATGALNDTLTGNQFEIGSLLSI
jgi:hypothetical protein